MNRRIAFVACNKNPSRFLDDPSFIYRCENHALALRNLGHHVDLVHYTTFKPQHHYHLVVFHRPSFRAWFDHLRLPLLLKKTKATGARLIADFDDLVFDPSQAATSPGVINGIVSLEQTKKNFKKHLATLQYFHAFTVSTTPLQASLAAFVDTKAITVIHNTAHQSWYNKTPSKTDKEPDKFVISYFPGTKSHDQDLALIMPPLLDFIHQHDNVELLLTGSLIQEPSLPSQRVRRHARVTYADYWRHVASSDLNLAPLEDTLFNHNKSALKALEAGFWNIPTIASEIPDMRRLAGNGVAIASSTDDWWQLMCHYYQADRDATIRQRLQSLYSTEDAVRQLLAL